MKKLIYIILSLLLFFATANAQQEDVYYIPLGAGLNTETPSHLLGDGQTPYSKNVIFEGGVVKKAFGLTKVHEFDGEIKGYFQATDDYALIAAHNGADPGGVVFYEWNMEVGTDAEFIDLNIIHLTATDATMFAAYGGGSPDYPENAGLFDPDATWQFCNHYDDVNGYVTIMTNGKDAIHKYIHPSQTVSGIYESWQERKIDYLQNPACDADTRKVKGYYVASFYDALYLANITADIAADSGECITSTSATQDKVGILWSDINNASSFDITQYYAQRPEGGTPITGLAEYQDYLYLFKEDQTWSIAPFDNFTRVNKHIGCTNQDSVISFNSLYVNDRGRIMDIVNGTWLSYPINTQFASGEAGTWYIYGRLNRYNNKISYTSGTKMYTYDMGEQGWEVYNYSAPVDILHYLKPGRPFVQWVGEMQYHDRLTIRQEDTISDYVVKYGTDGDTLAIMNHFTFNDIINTSDDVFEKIECIYTTKQDALGYVNVKKRVQEIILHGLPNMDGIKVYGWFSDAPIGAGASWEYLGEIDTDSNGMGQLWIDKRSLWCSIRLIHDSTDNFEISAIGVKFVPGTIR